ncbi:MAG TPA: DNA internalization-related competence protein ComEC/Rec2 [Actinomycetota bacterium]|nr:DNA internalization-related competence protein ComEC/Rec2 [Actinomycetota bacterium]
MGLWLLPAAVAGLWGGVLLAGFSPGLQRRGPAALLLCLGVVLAAPVAVGGRRSRREGSARPVGWALLAATALAFWALGAGWGGLRLARARDSPLPALGGRAVEARGRLVSEPRATDTGWAASLQVGTVVTSPPGVQTALRLDDTVRLEGEDAPPPSLARGDRLLVRGWLHALRGEFGDSLRRRGYVARLEAVALERLGPPSDPLQRVANALRSAMARSLARVLPDREAGLLMGLAIGDTSRLDPTVDEDFRATGLSHLTAVSGQNVAMFLAPVLAAAGLLRAGRRGRFALGVGVAAFFVLLTGAEPSVLRAAAMACLGMLGVALGRPRSSPATLGGAVLALLAVNPGLVHAVGFQLSVAATAGLSLLGGPLLRRLARLPEWVAAPAATTLAAQLGVLPLLLYHFGVVPTVALPANVLAFPAVAPAMLLGLLAGAVGLLLPPLGPALGLVARLPLAYLEGVAHRLARAPLPSITSPGGQWPLLVGGLGAVALGGWWVRSGRRLGRPAALGLAVALPVVLLAAGLRSGPPGGFTVTFFDVGQGDAALVRSARGATILVDGGPQEHEVARKLAALGVRRLDLLVATHPHADHIGGLPAVLARFRVAMVLEPGCGGDSPFQDDFLRALRAAGAPVRHPPPGTVLLVGDLRVEVLGPEGCFRGTDSDPNNDSLVLRVTDGAWSVLFPGDAEEPAQRELLEAAGLLRATVLKVPHHGGGTSLEAFFEAVDAQVAVVSVGPNRYGHPDPAVLAELEEEGARVLRTDRLGDLTLWLRPSGVLVESGRA